MVTRRLQQGALRASVGEAAGRPLGRAALGPQLLPFSADLRARCSWGLLDQEQRRDVPQSNRFPKTCGKCPDPTVTCGPFWEPAPHLPGVAAPPPAGPPRALRFWAAGPSGGFRGACSGLAGPRTGQVPRADPAARSASCAGGGPANPPLPRGCGAETRGRTQRKRELFPSAAAGWAWAVLSESDRERHKLPIFCGMKEQNKRKNTKQRRLTQAQRPDGWLQRGGRAGGQGEGLRGAEGGCGGAPEGKPGTGDTVTCDTARGRWLLEVPGDTL